MEMKSDIEKYAMLMIRNRNNGMNMTTKSRKTQNVQRKRNLLVFDNTGSGDGKKIK